MSDLDIYKTLSFQLGQTIALTNSVELYTKEEIMLVFPELSSMLKRESTEGKIHLERLKNELIAFCLKNKHLIIEEEYQK